MKITKAKAKNLEDVVIALKPVIRQPLKDSREENIILAPYNTRFYSFGYLSGWYLASCKWCIDHKEDFSGDDNNQTKNYFLYKEAFERYMLSMDVSVEKALQIGIHLKRYSTDNKVNSLNDKDKLFLKNHTRMVAYLIQEHYTKLFTKYDLFDEQGIPLEITIHQDESEVMNSMILKQRDITL